MRIVLGLIIGILLGFMLGGLGPRRELAAAMAHAQDLDRELAQASRRARNPFAAPIPGLNQAFEKAEVERERLPDPDLAPGEEEGGDEALAADEAPGEDGVVEAQPRPDPEAMQRELSAAVDAQRARAKQTRAALAEQADLSDEELGEFDDIVADMNDALAVYAEDMVRWADEEPDTVEALAVAHEVTGILYESQSALVDLIGEDALGEVDEAAQQVWNYVDLEPFADAFGEQALGGGSGGPSGGAGGGLRRGR